MKPKRTPAALKRLQIIHDEADKGIAAKVDGPVSCKAGCSNCCQQFVAVTHLEAVNMLEESARVGYTIDTIEMVRQRNRALNEPMTRQKWFGTKCIFLTSAGMCAVHRRRPLSCRGVLVASDPRQCGDPDGRVSKYNMKEPNFSPKDPTTWGPVLGGALKVQVEHKKANIPGVMGPVALMVDMAMRGKDPTELAGKVDMRSGIIGLSGETWRGARGPDDEQRVTV